MSKAIANLKTWQKVALAIAALFLLAAVLGAIFGSEGRNNEFQPQNEFKLDPWIEIKIGALDLSITKAVLYLFLATGLTTGAMIYIAKRMQQRPNNLQTLME